MYERHKDCRLKYYQNNYSAHSRELTCEKELLMNEKKTQKYHYLQNEGSAQQKQGWNQKAEL